MRVFSRHSTSINAVATGNNNVSFLSFSPKWLPLPMLSVAYSKIYDQWKPLKAVVKYFLLIPSNQLAEGASKVQHWWVYDPDSSGRRFNDVNDFTNHPNVRWNFMTPYKVSTHRLKAKFLFDMNEDHSNVVTGLKKMDNPWRNMEEWANGVGQPRQNYNSIQHLFISQRIASVAPFSIIQQSVCTYMLRGNRNGQQYAL